MRWQEGDRVGAVCGETATAVRFFGYGTYQGRHVPPAGVDIRGVDLHALGVKTAQIRLDNGDTVWGCQCWWEGEDAVRLYLARVRKRVVPVRIADVLREAE